MSDFSRNIWAPWRMEYIRSLEEQAHDVGCFLCHYWQHPRDDAGTCSSPQPLTRVTWPPLAPTC